MKKSKKITEAQRRGQIVSVYDDCGTRSYVCDDKQCRLVSYCDRVSSCYDVC